MSAHENFYRNIHHCKKTPQLLFEHIAAIATDMTFAKTEKQFIYLHKLLKRNEHNWTKKLFFIMKKVDIGWSKHTTKKLSEYNLEEDLNVIIYSEQQTALFPQVSK